MEHNENFEKKEFEVKEGFLQEEFIDEEAMYLEELKQKQNDFLDIYAEYLKVHTTLAKNILQRKTIELEVIDPTFDFKLK